MTTPISIIEAMSDPNLLGDWLGSAETWVAWLVVLKAAFALPMDDDELALFETLAGGRAPPTRPVKELVVIAGRRAGKSTIVAALAVYYATLRDFKSDLRRGEMGVIPIVASDRKQCQVILKFVKSALEAPLFAPLVTAEKAEGVELSTGCAIQVMTCRHRSLRGYSCPLFVGDEVGFWRDETSRTSADREVLAAVRPSQATFRDPMLVLISTPYRRSGALYEYFDQHFGKESTDTLVIQAESRDLNPTIDASVIEAELERDPAAARAEWLGQWRDDVSGFCPHEVAEAAIDIGVEERRPTPGKNYVAFTDASGGVRDSFTLGIAHRDGDAAVLDLIRERRAPFNPEAVAEEYAAELKGYGLSTVRGDAYAAEWTRQAFRKFGIEYMPAPMPRSQIYLTLLPMLTSGRVLLLDHKRLLGQLTELERRPSRSGHDVVDHPPRGSDDLINAGAGALTLLAKPAAEPRIRRLDGPGPARPKPSALSTESWIRGPTFGEWP